MSERIEENLWLHRCNRCGYKWTSRSQGPGTCANKECRSPYWNKPRKKTDSGRADLGMTTVLRGKSKNLEMVAETAPIHGTSDYLVAFSTSRSFCVGVVDIVNSTKISAKVTSKNLSKFYEIFFNSVSRILPRYGGKVVKNLGDTLLYYFPETSKSTKFGFGSCLESALAMVEKRDAICKILKKEGLPEIDFRVSLDYGQVVLIDSKGTGDLIGPPVNMCVKINRAASKNGAVIGGDLYSMVRKMDDYKFTEVKGFYLGFKNQYPIFKLERKMVSGKNREKEITI